MSGVCMGKGQCVCGGGVGGCVCEGRCVYEEKGRGVCEERRV
jgi:hypothetical protein